MHSQRLFAAVLLGSVAATAPLAAAQQGDSGAQAGEDASEQQYPSEDVVVTAQRREQRLVDVPISVAAVSGSELTDSGILNTRDLTQVIPGLTLQSVGFLTAPTIRGITSTGTAAGDSSNVALYVDDAYVASASVALFDLRNIDRIEVLKGPQGTLFGRNATGGAIRVITREPSTDPSLEVDIRRGFDFNQQEVSVYGTHGLGSNAAIDLTYFGYSDDGFVTNVAPGLEGQRLADSDRYALRSRFLYEPSSNFMFTAAVDYSNSFGSTELTSDVFNGNSQYNATAGVVLTNGPYQSSVSTPTYLDIENFGVVARLEFTLGGVDVAATSAYRDSILERQVDNDKTNLDISGNRRQFTEDNWSQEIQFSGSWGERWDYIAGLMYFQGQGCGCNDMSFTGPVPELGGTISNLSSYVVNTQATSIFGELTFRPTERLEFIGGVRFDHEEKDFWIARTIPSFATNTDSASWDNVSYRLTGSYNFTEDSMVYATLSTGFKSGQYGNSITPVTLVDPETITAFEIGAKAEIGDSVLLSAAAFHYDYEDIQILARDPFSFQNVLQNAAKAEIIGFDAEARIRVTDELSVALGVAWLPTAEYTDFPNAVVLVRRPPPGGNLNTVLDLGGTPILRSPEVTFNTSFAYERALPIGTLRLSGSYYYNDGFYFNAGEGPQQPAYDVINLQVGWRDPSDRFTLYLWGSNVGDTVYYAGESSSTAGDAIYYARPQEFGIGLTANF